MKALIPGTVIPYAGFDGDVFDLFRPMLRAADGLSLAQVCSITGLEAPCIQNWVKRGFVPHPIKKRYYERQLARILMISALRESMQIERIVQLLALVNGDVESEADDLIEESRLFDMLCRVSRDTETLPLANAQAEESIARVSANYRESRPGDKVRLEEALTVMLYAHLACRLKREADLAYMQLCGG